MTGEELFDLFVAHGTTRAEITALDLNTLTRQIAEMRLDSDDDIPMSDDEIAVAIRDYAAGWVWV